MKNFITLVVMLFAILLVLGMCSCRSAEKLVNKAVDKDKAKVAAMTRDLFPCDSIGSDSTEYKAWKDSVNQVLKTNDSLVRARAREQSSLTRIIDSLRKVPRDTGCNAELELVYKQAAKIQQESDRLERTVDDLRDRLRTIKPTEKIVLDQASMFLARDSTAKALDEAAKWKAKYEAEHDIVLRLEDRIKGKILIPWWWTLIIAAILVFIFRNSIKSLIMKKLIPFVLALVLFSLSSCTKWSDGSPGNVWNDGLWIIFWLPLIGAGICWYFVYKGSQSNSVKWDVESNRKTPFWKVQYFPWAVALTITTVLIYLLVTKWEN